MSRGASKRRGLDAAAWVRLLGQASRAQAPTEARRCAFLRSEGTCGMHNKGATEPHAEWSPYGERRASERAAERSRPVGSPPSEAQRGHIPKVPTGTTGTGKRGSLERGSPLTGRAMSYES